LPKAGRALVTGGYLTLLWNRPSDDALDDPGFREELADVYRIEAHHLLPGLPGERNVDRRAKIEASGEFAELVRDDFHWTAACSTQEYLGLLETQS
jgi:hypothetical protein